MTAPTAPLVMYATTPWFRLGGHRPDLPPGTAVELVQITNSKGTTRLWGHQQHLLARTTVDAAGAFCLTGTQAVLEPTLDYRWDKDYFLSIRYVLRVAGGQDQEVLCMGPRTFRPMDVDVSAGSRARIGTTALEALMLAGLLIPFVLVGFFALHSRVGRPIWTVLFIALMFGLLAWPVFRERRRRHTAPCTIHLRLDETGQGQLSFGMHQSGVLPALSWEISGTLETLTDQTEDGLPLTLHRGVLAGAQAYGPGDTLTVSFQVPAGLVGLPRYTVTFRAGDSDLLGRPVFILTQALPRTSAPPHR